MNWDVIIPLIGFLVLVFLIGIYASKHISKAPDFLQEYFLGSRQLNGFILALTMVATFGSASSFVGGPGVAYNLGLGWVLLAMSQLVTGYFTLAVLGKKFAIIARKINAVTLIDFLKERYQSKWVVLLSAASIIIFLFSAMAAQWIGGGRLIESFTGLSYTTALFIFAISVLVYVVIGGFRAVAITDSLQGIVMFIGTLLLLIGTIIAGGGLTNIMTELTLENPNLVSPYGADRSLTPLFVSSFWILVGVGVVGLPQVSVRAMSYRDSKAMHKAMIIGTVVVGFIMLGMHLIGVFARVVIPGVEVGDKVMPLVALEVLPGWLAGIVLAAPMAAVMSTVDSFLLLVSSAVIKDVYVNYVKPSASQRQVKTISLSVTALLGVLVFLMAVNPPDLLIWLNLFAFGGLEAAFIWPVVLGLYWKKGNAYGAFTSMFVGVGSYMLIHLNEPNLFGMHTVVVPIVLSFIGYIVASLATQHKHPTTQQQITQRFWGV
ncbi:sodium/pantothenate symporter [Pseudalkalibacillus berkeleyi]|uniref:Sodium/pantothenate symporter n=1 Tax=Pseudalkalibacillus berkeleyi TaxID=1069813 RepID=A0ABS9H450_9BACL|nr:sodium/pantothenate symporter [Pseudalkalibacillus berkeleyi]MCF6138851.1 sodium/pantothenate symporter [Pseudalkalibacillus berkeleyi]